MVAFVRYRVGTGRSSRLCLSSACLSDSDMLLPACHSLKITDLHPSIVDAACEVLVVRQGCAPCRSVCRFMLLLSPLEASASSLRVC